jgi:dCMP deaminase
MIIGLTGRNCAGKGEAANYLQKSSFIYYSLSDILREDLVKAGLPETRENLIAFGKKLREEKGLGVLALQVLEKIDPDKNYVIDSIRHPEEVLALKKNKDFFLIAVHANADLRFERIQKRGRQGDVKTLEEFVAELKKVTVDSIYYHMFEAKLRLEKGENDFSLWLDTAVGEKELARKISRLDPYTYTMESLREKIIAFASACLTKHGSQRK